MGKYEYSNLEKDINKVFKMNEEKSEVLKSTYLEMNSNIDSYISSSEQLLKELGLEDKLGALKKKTKVDKINRDIEIQLWEDIVEEANELYKYDIELEDILLHDEFKKALDDYKRIENEFSNKIKLNKTDGAFLIVATVLQTIKSLVIAELGEKLSVHNRIDDKSGDKLVKKEKAEYLKSHEKWEEKISDKGYKTWKEIIFTGVPYDATKGSPNQGIKMEGMYHRYKTLGHDPILGWVFGTANIVTSTITLNNFNSYRVKNMSFTDEQILLHKLFIDMYESLDEDFNRLPAAIFRQAMHLKSDAFTKLGLPVPIIGAFSEDFAGKLYKSQYDSLCLARDTRVCFSAVLSITMDMIISLIHGLFYNEKNDGERDFYEARTRKILMYSNSIASTSNIIYAYIRKNPKALDIGGLLITAIRLFSDTRFIIKLKDEFISSQLEKGFEQELEKLDNILKNYDL